MQAADLPMSALDFLPLWLILLYLQLQISFAILINSLSNLMNIHQQK